MQQVLPIMHPGAHRAWVDGKRVPLEEDMAQKSIDGAWFNHFPARNLIWTTLGAMPFTGNYGYYYSTYARKTLKLCVVAKRDPEQGVGWNYSQEKRSEPP